MITENLFSMKIIEGYYYESHRMEIKREEFCRVHGKKDI